MDYSNIEVGKRANDNEAGVTTSVTPVAASCSKVQRPAVEIAAVDNLSLGAKDLNIWETTSSEG